MSFNGFKTFCEELLASIFHFLLEVLMAPMAGASPVALAAAVTDGGGHAWRCLERGFENLFEGVLSLREVGWLLVVSSVCLLRSLLSGAAPSAHRAVQLLLAIKHLDPGSTCAA